MISAFGGLGSRRSQRESSLLAHTIRHGILGGDSTPPGAASRPDSTKPVARRPVSPLGMTEASRPARLRFAPSPVGDMHVGHLRALVFTNVLARQLGGSYFVRFEGTDKDNQSPGARTSILDDLEWLGLSVEEPPHDQSAMKDSYREALAQLEAGGHSYRDGEAIRFRIPSNQSVAWDDLVRGRVTVDNTDLYDPVLVRSDGTPTFFLAGTVDDIDDEITHFVRPDVALRLTATQYHVWQCLGTGGPLSGHIPLVMRSDGKPIRFSDRDYTIKALREVAIPPAAIVVYLAMPQTASSKTPPVSLDQLLGRIDIARLSRRPLRFDLDALGRLAHRLSRASS